MPASDHRDPPLFRFDLQQFFSWVTAVCVLFAALALSQGVAAVVILLMAIVVTMHVFATSLGSRLRERADRRLRLEGVERAPLESVATASELSERLVALRSGPRSPWHARGTTVLPRLRQLVMVAIVGGGVIGAAYLTLTIGYRTSPAGVVVGGLSVAVLCGWFAFLVGSFYGVFRHGLHDAVAEQRNDMHH